MEVRNLDSDKNILTNDETRISILERIETKETKIYVVCVCMCMLKSERDKIEAKGILYFRTRSFFSFSLSRSPNLRSMIVYDM